VERFFAAWLLMFIAAESAAGEPVVYVTGLISTYTSASDCPPADFGCTSAQPVSDRTRRAFFDELKKKGLKVVTAQPPGVRFVRVSAALRNIDMPKGPDQDGRYIGTCELTAVLQGGSIPQRLRELDQQHRFRVTADDFGPGQRLLGPSLEGVLTVCFRWQAHWIAEIIKKYP
jgi:hypothetical protein